MNKSGFALIEILVAVMLLVAVSAVAFSSFSSSTKVTQSPNNNASNVARSVLDQLYEYVRDDQWQDNITPQRLNPATAGNTFPAKVLNGVTFTPAYTVASVDPDGVGSADDYRKVTTTVCWNGAAVCP